MQLQLSLTVADRLHETLLTRGEPLPALEAARLLLAAPRVPESIALEVLGVLVRHDRRFCHPTSGSTHLSLRHWETPDPDLSDVPFVALDLETTGSRPGAAKITEIGAVRLEGLQEVAHFHTLVNPQRPIPPIITQITGITPEMVADAPRIDEVIPQLLEFLEDAVIVAHNAPFDVAFLNYELRRLKGHRLGEGAFDTLPLARLLAPGLPNYRLGTVAEALGAPVAACHRALADARAAAHVFLTLVGRLQERGVTRLREARTFVGPSGRPALEKLRLTRDLPQAPGVYRFLDASGVVLYVGKADRLRERVRSHFLAGPGQTRKLRQALRLVDRVDWEETATPLEAVVREQQQIQSHRPPCNLFGSRPENYAYLKVSASGPGLSLSLSARCQPRSNGSGASGKAARAPVLIGPFRGHARLRAALELLQRCYPIRRCPRQPDGRPCVRFKRGGCLAPCTADPKVRAEHDALVYQLLGWLTGDDGQGLSDPLERADALIQSLSRQRRFEEAQAIREASEHLLSVRRSYRCLAEARALRFAALWPQNNGGSGRSVRLNLVWDGNLCHALSLEDGEGSGRGLSSRLDDLLQPLFAKDDGGGRAADEAPGGTKTANRRFVAVGQRELDELLAVRRWMLEAGHPHLVLFPGPGASPQERAACRARLAAEVRRLLGDTAPTPSATCSAES
jgi:DNA polymerase-3 subunit epsilon